MKKIIKNILKIVIAILLVVVILAGGYVGYILISYHRIGDMDIQVNKGNTQSMINTTDSYNVTTYNIGFGAYSQDFTFFLDTGYDSEGNETVGHYSKAKSKEEVLHNINGSIDVLKGLENDFILLQEVDVKSTRSHKVNQRELIYDTFKYDEAFAFNFDSAFLPYPLYDMHGKSKAGIQTLSKYEITAAKRVEYTISKSFSKFFDLDRCFSVSTINVDNGKKLYLINSHMSAYDEGGVIRQQQINELNEYLSECSKNGDYVIVGGDFNHDLLTYNPDYNYTNENRVFNNTLKDPDWVASYFDINGNSPLIEGFKVIASDNVPTCRNNDITWNPDKTYTCVVDGFIVSNNIEVINHYNVETPEGNLNYKGFAYSDHQPAFMTFKLK